DAVWGVTYSPDGITIATASIDSTVKLWDFNFENLMMEGCDWLENYFLNQSPELLIELEICQNTSLTKKIAPRLVARGKERAREGHSREAIDLLKQALEWDSSLDFSPHQTAQASALVAEGVMLAQAGDISPAVEKFTKANQLDKGSISATDWDHLCWNGGIHNQASEVLFACEKAVALAPKNVIIIDSRGLAYALTGKTKEAIADFKIFVNSTIPSEEGRAQRQRWITALEKGENPMTPRELESLRE
ncbi:MAG: ribosome assembly protein 4, partial [Cyanobacteria bacterium P01_F01_bin.53]